MNLDGFEKIKLSTMTGCCPTKMYVYLSTDGSLRTTLWCKNAMELNAGDKLTALRKGDVIAIKKDPSGILTFKQVSSGYQIRPASFKNYLCQCVGPKVKKLNVEVHDGVMFIDLAQAKEQEAAE